MGRPKLLLPWGDNTVLGHLISEWQHVGAEQIAVVCASGDEALNQELDRLNFPPVARIVNPEPARGMFSSIQCAAQWRDWQEAITHWVITLGDQPHLTRNTLRALAEFAALNAGSICQPAHSGRARHPVVLPRRYWELLAATTHATLKEFLIAHRDSTQRLELPDAGLALDLDTPADYEEALGKFRERSDTRGPRQENNLHDDVSSRTRG
jgi:molybdenum cofactor cytidylyltransferase